MHPKDYQPVEQVDVHPNITVELEEQAAFLFTPSQKPTHLSVARWPWIISTVILFIIATILLFRDGPQCPFGNESYEAGFNTDLSAAFPVIEIHKTRFTGGLHWDENGTLVRNPLPDGKEWVGPPSPELDARWDHVVDAAGIDVSGTEADMVRGTTRQRPTGEYITGLDVFHQLHCLNKLRQSLYPDYYPDPDGPLIMSLHIEHCIDYLRQSIMCNSDMTAVRVVYSPSADRWSPDFEREHTCRNFEKLLDWSLERLNPETDEFTRSGNGAHSAGHGH